MPPPARVCRHRQKDDQLQRRRGRPAVIADESCSNDGKRQRFCVSQGDGVAMLRGNGEQGHQRGAVSDNSKHFWQLQIMLCKGFLTEQVSVRLYMNN